MSNKTRTSVDRATQTSEAGTQTGMDELNTPARSPIYGNGHRNMIDGELVHEPEEVDYTKIDLGPYSSFDNSSDNDRGTSTRDHSGRSGHHDEHDTSYTSEEDEDEPVIYEAAAATSRAPQINLVKAKGSLVTIPRRVPPPLPPRHPMRSSAIMESSIGSQTSSPSKDGFEEVELNGQRVDVVSERRGVESPVVLVNGVQEENINEEKLEEEKTNGDKIEEEKAHEDKAEEKRINGDEVEEEKANEDRVEEEKINSDKIEEVKTNGDIPLDEEVEKGVDHTDFAHTETEPGKLESEKHLSSDTDEQEEGKEEKKPQVHAERKSTDSISKTDGNDDFHSLPETPLEGSVEGANQWA